MTIADAPPSACLCSTLRQTMRAVTRMYDDALRPAGLRITQYSLLNSLSTRGEMRVRDLGEALVLEETTLTRGLSLLEDQGWIKSRAGADRRERHVAITSEGKKLLKKARPLWLGAQAQLKEQVTDSTWDGLFRGLPKVAEAAQAQNQLS